MSALEKAIIYCSLALMSSSLFIIAMGVMYLITGVN